MGISKVEAASEKQTTQNRTFEEFGDEKEKQKQPKGTVSLRASHFSSFCLVWFYF